MSRRTISRLRLDERIAGERASIWSRDRMSKREAELLGHLVLPLLDEAAGRDDQAAFEVAADQQFLDQQAGHDGLAGAGIVGEQEAQRLARQHFAVDGGDLVRQRFDLGGADGEIGIEQMRQAGCGKPRTQAARGRRRRRSRRSGQLPRTRSRSPRHDRRGVRRRGRSPERRGSGRPGRSARPARLRRSPPGRGRAGGRLA